MLKRIISLTKKEFRQFVRDKSSLMIGFLLPIFLILIFGYALSFDVRDAKLAVVMDDNSPKVVDIVISLNLSEYLTLEPVRSYHKAVQQLERREIDGFLHFQSDFTNSLNHGSATIQLTLHGTEAVRASAISAYVNSALQVYQEKKSDESAKVELDSRMWFNAANNSTWYLVPGLIVLIMTLVGALLTALVMAREWERGTLEALFVSPVRPVEILISKMIPYFSVGMVGFVMCILAATFLFNVPIKGSLILITISTMLYMCVALGIGLLISALTKNQFLSSQIALLVSFLPAMMLSGFIFDQRNLPLGIWLVSKFVPATYFMELIKTLFLAGNNWYLFFVDCGIMLLWAAFLLGISWFATRKRLD